jgi:hypothetical protein
MSSGMSATYDRARPILLKNSSWEGEARIPRHYGRSGPRDTRGQPLEEISGASGRQFVLCGVAREFELTRSLGGEIALGVEMSFSTE